jgi:hypothetical protein
LGSHRRYPGFDLALEKLTGGVRVADGGLLIDSEDEREVERVGAPSYGSQYMEVRSVAYNNRCLDV